ncbi:MAG: response regulator [Chloroflexi bacterium]|nr:MAG: response regulator [Chloroflexota bacterium]
MFEITENGSEKARVLVVDDQAGILRMLKVIFEASGFEVEVAQDGEEALQKVQDFAPDLVVLDVMMPGMSGIDVCRHLRSQPETAHIPIMMLSAKGQVPDKVLGFEAGADDYVTKPVARQELVARAKALLHRARFSPQSAVVRPTAQIIAVVGAKGGVGTTTIAINLAALLAADGKVVTLAEMRTTPGTAAFHLNMTPRQDLGHILQLPPEKLNWREVNRRLVKHSSGIRLLAAPQSHDAPDMPPEYATAITEALALRCDYLFVDLPTIAGESARSILETVDQILLITEPEVLSVRAARAKLDILKEWLLFDQTRVVVLARAPSAMMLKREEIEASLGVVPEDQTGISPLQTPAEGGGRVVGAIPPSPEAFQAASRTGIPVVIGKPDLLASQAIRDLKKWLVEQVALPTTSLP